VDILRQKKIRPETLRIKTRIKILELRTWISNREKHSQDAKLPESKAMEVVVHTNSI